MKEVWQAIPGYEGIYEASSTGHIRTVLGKVTSNARFPKRVWKQRGLKEKRAISKNRSDPRVTLYKDGKPKDFKVATLVSMAFLQHDANDGYTVNHINGDWNDNRIENLELLTLSDNIKYGFTHGQYKRLQKSVSLQSDDEEIHFNSMAEADRFLERREGYTSLRLKRKSDTGRDRNGKIYKIKAIS